MSSEETPVIRIRNLSKIFVTHVDSHRTAGGFPTFRRKGRLETTVIHDLSMDINFGETFGIVGRNGAGKSTLLRILSGTLNETSGSVEIRGRVAPLLGLGAGFEPQFTGRENVLHNSLIAGASKDEIEDRMEEVLEFAGIGDYVDQPVHVYSSGMYARLAFSAAIHTHSQVYVIDEILAVGDELFSRKCFGKLAELKSEGATIVLVSHAATAVSELCDRVAILEAGERILTASPKTAISRYQRLLFAPVEKAKSIVTEIKLLDAHLAGGTAEGIENFAPNDSAFQKNELKEGFDTGLVPESTVAYEENGARILNARIENSQGDPMNVLLWGKTYFWSFEAHFKEDASKVRFGMMLKTVTGFEFGGQTSHTWDGGISHVPAGTKVRLRFSFWTRLNPGVYFLNCGVTGMKDGAEVFLHRILDAAALRIQHGGDDLGYGAVDIIGPEPFDLIPLD